MNYDLTNVRVDISKPVQVGHAGGHLWFPVLYRLDDRRILCGATVAADEQQGEWPARVFLSDDRGDTWRHALDIPCYASGAVLQQSGKLLLQPYELWPQSQEDGRNLKATGTLMSADDRGRLQLERTPVQVLGLPRPWRCNGEGKTVNAAFHPAEIRLKDGRLIGTLYGKYSQDQRYTLCTITSADDGRTWRYQSLVAGIDVAPGSKEGPNEADIAGLTDGRLVCIFRVGARQTYWISESRDEGSTWETATPLPDVGSVLPKLMSLADGTLLLSGGRAGIHLWVNVDGSARTWQRIDLEAHHNANTPEPWHFPGHYIEGAPIASLPGETIPKWSDNGYGAASTCYTSMLNMGPDEIALVYDRIPNGWKEAPGPFGEHNFIFCIRVQVRRTETPDGK